MIQMLAQQDKAVAQLLGILKENKRTPELDLMNSLILLVSEMERQLDRALNELDTLKNQIDNMPDD